MTAVPLELAPPKLDNPLCAQVDTDLFFPIPGSDAAAAKAICARCDDRIPCLDWALATREPFGVYGGLTAHQRRALQRPGRRLQRRETHPREVSDATRASMAARARRLNSSRAAERNPA